MRRAIKTGLDDDSYAEVLEGELRAGDLVIIGEQRLRGSAGAAQPRMVGF